MLKWACCSVKIANSLRPTGLQDPASWPTSSPSLCQTRPNIGFSSVSSVCAQHLHVPCRILCTLFLSTHVLILPPLIFNLSDSSSGLLQAPLQKKIYGVQTTPPLLHHSGVPNIGFEAQESYRLRFLQQEALLLSHHHRSRTTPPLRPTRAPQV